MKKSILIVAAVFISSQLQAQQDSTKTLDDVVFTANKYPQKQSSTAKVLIVINHDQLEKNTGRTLTQVLNEQAGIVINGSQNPLGTNQTVYMRGALAANTLILVDGVPANDASGISDQFDLNHFAIDQIERVEILKGAQSVLYGSQAVAGVINIITKKYNGSKKVGVNASLAGGTYGTFKAAAGINGKIKAISYGLQYSKLKSDGFSISHDETGNNNFDNDGFDQDVVGLNIGAGITKTWQVRFFGQYGQYKADADDGAFTDDRNSSFTNKNLQATISSVYKFKMGSATVNLNLNNTDRKLEDQKNVPDDPFDYDPYTASYKGRSIFAEAFTNLNLHKHLGLLVGVDFRDNKASIESTYGRLGDDSLKSNQLSGYVSFSLRSLGGFNAELGGRVTNHSAFGSTVTYSLNPSYTIFKQVKLFANLASAFLSPSVYQLASEYGNKDLKPERSASYDAGVQYGNTKNTMNFRFAYFNRTIKDIILFNSLFVPPYGQYGNADKQKDHGVELEATIRPTTKLSIVANYTFVDGKIETKSAATGKDTSFNNLVRRPKNTISTTIGYQVCPKFFASIGARWVDKRDDQFFNSSTFETETVVLKDYYNLDALISYQPLSFIKIFVDLRNITNQQYFDLYGYNARRFNFMAGATINF